MSIQLIVAPIVCTHNLAGRIGAGVVKGIQEKDVGVSLKHFATNNSERYRSMGNSIVDERALREIYLVQMSIHGHKTQERMEDVPLASNVNELISCYKQDV